MPQSSIQVPSPDAIQAALFPDGLITAPALPSAWSANVLLTPHGNVKGDVSKIPDQLIAARLYYDSTNPHYRSLRARFYLIEDMHYFDLIFKTEGNSTFLWIVDSDPDASPDVIKDAKGPFPVNAQVPGLDFLKNNSFQHVGSWKIVGEVSHAFSGHKTKKPSTWWWFSRNTNSLRRIMNVDGGNDFASAVLGSYYFVDFASLDTSPNGLSVLTGQLPKQGDLLTMSARTASDILSIFKISVPQTFDFIVLANVLPGISKPASYPKVPAWSDSVAIECYMMGQDNYPYYCQVWYDWNRGQQITVFVQKGQTNKYDARFDEVLPRGSVGPAIIYEWNGKEWHPSCSQKDAGFVPMPVPNFVEAGGGQCRAAFKGSPYFGNSSIWSVKLGDDVNWSDFWYWFDDNQNGILFSLAPASSLTLIDYQSFVRDAVFDPAKLEDPSDSVPTCGSASMVALQGKPRLIV